MSCCLKRFFNRGAVVEKNGRHTLLFEFGPLHSRAHRPRNAPSSFEKDRRRLNRRITQSEYEKIAHGAISHSERTRTSHSLAENLSLSTASWFAFASLRLAQTAMPRTSGEASPKSATTPWAEGAWLITGIAGSCEEQIPKEAVAPDALDRAALKQPQNQGVIEGAINSARGGFFAARPLSA